MKNIELKIAITSFGKITNTLKNIGTEYKGKLRQIDTYYNCPKGSMKIREINNHDFELIFYQRPDKKASKVSYYLVSKIEKAQLKTTKTILKEALGEKVIVKKQRDLWLYKNTRIHLDKVKGLGNFLELETAVEKAGKNAMEEHNKIINLLNLSEYKKCGSSYGDMLTNKKNGVRGKNLQQLWTKVAVSNFS